MFILSPSHLKSKKLNAKGFSLVVILLAVVIFAGLVYGTYFYFQQQRIKNINSFEECAKYYPVMESYPTQCNTKDGRSFTQKLSEEEQKRLEDEFKELEDSKSDSTNWSTYQATRFYQIEYPLDKYSIRSGPANINASWPGIINLEPNDIFNEEKPLAVTYQVSIGIKENKEGYTRENLEQYFGKGLFIKYGKDSLKDIEIKNTKLGGLDALRIDGCCGGQVGVEANIVALKGDKIYEIIINPAQTSGNPDKNKAIYEKIIETFKFL